MMALFTSIGQFSIFAFSSLFDSIVSIGRPREVGRQFGRQLIGAMPLACVAGLAIGIVVWMHLRGVLARFGGASAVDYLPSALALAVILEFGPIAAGLIVAGRAGASLAAELSAMKLTEQIDALSVLGVSAQRQLVGPRVLSCMLVLPLVTIFIDYLALTGSFVAESMTSGTTWLHYRSACLRGLSWDDMSAHTLKTLFFGFFTGVSGCYHGLMATGGSEAVGTAATRGVVSAIFGVLLADVVLVRIIHLATLG
jgi:phospholipid/cholesterol/gamma-HCH transport system permease protein